VLDYRALDLPILSYPPFAAAYQAAAVCFLRPPGVLVISVLVAVRRTTSSAVLGYAPISDQATASLSDDPDDPYAQRRRRFNKAAAPTSFVLFTT
jgi:hypothetical protein